MNDAYFDQIPDIIEELGDANCNLFTFKIPRTSWGHPTEQENVNYTNLLYDLIVDIQNWM